MTFANRRAAAMLCLVAVFALPAAGCEDAGDSRPRVMLDDAGPAGVDAGSASGDAGSFGVDAGSPADPGCGDPIEQEQLRITNAERTAAGLAPLVCDLALTRAARLHSQDMCDRRYFSHDSLDGRTFRDRIDAQGVRWTRIGENIAWGQPTPEAVHQAWMGSSGHRANIMSGNFGRIGIGHVACGAQGPYWTQDFAD